MGRVFIGTSGYQYKAWAGDFYPADLPQRLWLEYYAGRFDSVEINSSFYRLPSAGTFAKWREQTPDEFVFALKGSRYLTHQLRLREAEEPVARLFERAAELGSKLGVVLWQLPESMPRQLSRLSAFCEVLSQHSTARGVRQAFEFRHASWFVHDTYAILERYNYALVLNQSSAWPTVEVATADWTYARFHGPAMLYSSEYSDRQLIEWADKLERHSPGDCFAFFNNDVGNFAPKNAQTLSRYMKPSQ